MTADRGTLDDPLVSVVLPTYNERETIVEVVELAIGNLGREVGYEAVEVVVVDDDSPDGTWRVAREAFADDPRVDVVRRTDDQGLSSAVLEGFRLALGEYYVCMDADGQHPADRLPALVDALDEGADLVVGSRHVDGGAIDGWPWTRKVTSKVATLVARGLVPAARDISDPMSGFFAVNRTVFDDDVLEAADPHGYKILLELAQLAPAAAVAEVPITFRAREAGESKLTLDEQVRFLEHCLGLWFLSAGLDERVSPPLVVRSVEAASVVALALALMNTGLILGDVDGALGAGLIAASGAAVVLGAQRLARTGDSWSETREVFAK
jgi:dolichol-phosphate mannosyltransferase